MKWRVTLLAAQDVRHSYEVETGWEVPVTNVQLMRERNEAVKRARQLHRAETGKPGVFAEMEPVGWTIPQMRGLDDGPRLPRST